MSLLEMLPDNYADSPEMCIMQNAFQKPMDDLIDSKEDFFAQLHVSTATWGLSLWEQTYGLETDITKSYEYRRARILSKMRGAGTTTKALIENVAESFSNGMVDIIEYPEICSFSIIFTGTLGTPPNMEDLTAAIEEIKPAHLAYLYTYIYRTHKALNKYTHMQMHKFTHAELRARSDIS